MTTTPHLALAYIATAQAQKEVTHNEALNDLDFLAQLSVLDTSLATPPATPSTGDAYLVASSPTGAWSGATNYVAAYYDGWILKAPAAGWRAWDQNNERLLTYTGSAWSPLATPTLDATLVWNPSTIASSSSVTSSTITVTGAALGDFVLVAAPYDLQGIQASAYVSAADTVTLLLTNLTGSGVTLASGTWRARVIKA